MTYHLCKSASIRGGWVLVGYGRTKATKRFETKATAFIWAKKWCDDRSAALVIHGADGRVQRIRMHKWGWLRSAPPTEPLAVSVTTENP